MSERSVFYRRKFLNKPKFQSGAHIIAEVTVEYGDEGRPFYYYKLKLADCNRIVEFDLADYNPKERANTVFKLDTLINTLVEFRGAVLKAHRELDEVDE